MIRSILLSMTLLALSNACVSSRWKVHGGPKECKKICEKWDMKLTGMVGVGDQSKYGPGATACVCEVKGNVGSVGVATSSAAVITALQESERRSLEQHSGQNSQHHRSPQNYRHHTPSPTPIH